MAGMDGSKYGDVQTVKLLLNHSTINVNMVNDFGNTALILASFYGKGEVVKVLLQCPMTNIVIQEWKGRTALETAREKAHEHEDIRYWKQKYEAIVEMIEHRSELLQEGQSTCPHANKVRT